MLKKLAKKSQCFQGSTAMSTISTPPTTTTPTNNINTFSLALRLYFGIQAEGKGKVYEIHGFKIDFYQ